MVREEKTGIRSLAYSYWHRTLDRKCTVVNLDWIECRWKYVAEYKERRPVIVAIIEDKFNKYGDTAWMSDTQRGVMLELADKLKVPVYLVTHNVQMDKVDYNRHNDIKSSDNIFWLPTSANKWKFEVKDLKTGDVVTMDEGEYRKWIESL